MSQYCKCGRNFSFETASLVLAPADWQAIRAWQCDLCGKIHHAHQEVQPKVRSPKSATAPLSSSGKRNGIWVNRWATAEPGKKIETLEYHSYPRKVPMSHDEPLLFSLWELLQSKVKIILGPPKDHETMDRAKYEARGIAEALAILMKPFMESADHVVKCAVKAYKDPDFEVPGLASYLWDPQFNHDGSPRVVVAQPKAKAARPAAKPKAKVDSKSTKTLSADEAAGIKEAVESGMFGKEEVASIFGVSMETLEQSLAS